MGWKVLLTQLAEEKNFDEQKLNDYFVDYYLDLSAQDPAEMVSEFLELFAETKPDELKVMAEEIYLESEGDIDSEEDF